MDACWPGTSAITLAWVGPTDAADSTTWPGSAGFGDAGAAACSRDTFDSGLLTAPVMRHVRIDRGRSGGVRYCARFGPAEYVDIVLRRAPVAVVGQTELLGFAPGNLMVDAIIGDAPDVPSAPRAFRRSQKKRAAVPRRPPSQS